MQYEINPEMPTVDWSNAPVKTAPNAKGFQVSSNPIQVRAVGRALAQLDSGEWALIQNAPKSLTSKSGGLAVHHGAIQHAESNEVRRVLGYNVVANYNTPYIATLDADLNVEWAKFGNGRLPRVENSMADGKSHTFYSVVVQRPIIEDDVNTGAIDAPELSRSRYSREYGKLMYKQQAQGIYPGDENFLHPFDFVPKDMLLYVLLTGRSIAIQTGASKETRSIIDQFYASEWGVNVMGLEYEEVVQELA